MQKVQKLVIKVEIPSPYTSKACKSIVSSNYLFLINLVTEIRTFASLKRLDLALALPQNFDLERQMYNPPELRYALPFF